MRIIKNEEYDEYQKLKENALIQSKFDSVRNTKYLKDDIDVPIRSVIAMLALLGCEPLFSCCGFDYDGQPLHKTHEYGCVFFQMKKNKQSEILIATLEHLDIVVKLSKEIVDDWIWEWWELNNIIFLRSAFTRQHKDNRYPWVDKRTCIHYCEMGVLNINRLEKALWKMKDYMLDEVTIVDTNNDYKTDKNIRNWQYPGLEPWAVTIDDVFMESNLK